MKTPKQGPALATNKRGRNSIDGDGGAPPTKKQGRAAHAAAGAASKGSGTDRAAAAHPSASKGRSGSHAIEAAQRRIWAPNVRSGKRDVGVVGDGACHGGDGVSVTPVVELARWMKMKKLRQKLHKLCSRAGQQVPRVPILAFERWQFNSKLQETFGPAARPSAATTATAVQGAAVVGEPLLPTTLNENAGDSGAGLVHDLVRGKIDKAVAEVIAADLAATSDKYAADIAALQLSTISGGGGEGAREAQDCGREVLTRAVGGVVDLWWGKSEDTEVAKPYMRISRAHLEKLRILFQRQRSAAEGGGAGGTGGEDGAAWEQPFLRAAFCLLLRYDALGGHGYQAAVGEDAFDVLLAQLNCQQECFASPFNCRYERFCSAFLDVDGPFGSIGSFFSPTFAPVRGCFQANPPFVPPVMEAMAAKIDKLLRSASGGLTFIVIVPAWTQLPFWDSLASSEWLRAPVKLLAAADHGYCDGAQHQRRPDERHRPSSFDTGVFLLQNAAAFASATAKSASRLDDVLAQFSHAMCLAKGRLHDIQAYEQRVRGGNVGAAGGRDGGHFGK